MQHCAVIIQERYMLPNPGGHSPMEDGYLSGLAVLVPVIVELCPNLVNVNRT